MAVTIGKKVPDFEIPAHTGEKVKLSDFSGKNIVLYFYPKDMTPGCTKEACDFRDYHGEFEKLDTVILGVSTDPVERHQNLSKNTVCLSCCWRMKIML